MQRTTGALPYYHADNDCPHGYANIGACLTCSPIEPYVTITATMLQPGHVLIDTARGTYDRVTRTEITASGYVLFNSERYPNVPRMSRSESQWRVTVASHVCRETDACMCAACWTRKYGA